MSTCEESHDEPTEEEMARRPLMGSPGAPRPRTSALRPPKGDKATILKVRIGSGDSAVDVTWNDEELLWVISSVKFGGWWFTVPNTPPAGDDAQSGYENALELADRLESIVQRYVRTFNEADALKKQVHEFVAALKDRKPEPKPETAPEP